MPAKRPLETANPSEPQKYTKINNAQTAETETTPEHPDSGDSTPSSSNSISDSDTDFTADDHSAETKTDITHEDSDLDYEVFSELRNNLSTNISSPFIENDQPSVKRNIPLAEMYVVIENIANHFAKIIVADNNQIEVDKTLISDIDNFLGRFVQNYLNNKFFIPVEDAAFTDLDETCFITAAIFLINYLDQNPAINLTSANIYDLLSVSLMMATKINFDEQLPALSGFSAISGIPAKKLEQLETEFAKGSQFKFFVSEKTYNEHEAIFKNQPVRASGASSTDEVNVVIYPSSTQLALKKMGMTVEKIKDDVAKRELKTENPSEPEASADNQEQFPQSTGPGQIFSKK